MRLAELNPRWAVDTDIVIGGVRRHYPDRHGMAISFDCPCCRGSDRAVRLAVWFANPADGRCDDASFRPEKSSGPGVLLTHPPDGGRLPA